MLNLTFELEAITESQNHGSHNLKLIQALSLKLGKFQRYKVKNASWCSVQELDDIILWNCYISCKSVNGLLYSIISTANFYYISPLWCLLMFRSIGFVSIGSITVHKVEGWWLARFHPSSEIDNILNLACHPFNVKWLNSHHILQDELMAWWSATSRDSAQIPSEEDLRLKVKKRKVLGF